VGSEDGFKKPAKPGVALPLEPAFRIASQGKGKG